MILYRPTDGGVLSTAPKLRPNTCFLMTQLGKPMPPAFRTMRKQVTDQLQARSVNFIDADSDVTGGDFLDKIWRMILAVPMGVAIIHEDMPPKTIANVFYELGLMDAHGKRTIIVKSPGAEIPSDFVRTEYIQTGSGFNKKFQAFLDSSFALEPFFEGIAGTLERDPLLSIDYLRRAYLISGDPRHRIKAKEHLDRAKLKGRAKDSVEMLLASF